MTDRPDSAIDRFLQDRGLLFGELTGGRLGRWTLPVAAGVEALAGAGLAVVGFMTQNLPLALSGSFFAVMGIGFGAGAVGDRRALQRTQLADLQLSPEASELLENLLQRAHASPFRARGARELLSPDAFRLLESVVHQYNRIQGILAAKTGSVIVQRLEPEIQAAAGEAVGAALHHAASVQRFPESLAAHEMEIEARTRLLMELAEQLERDEAARDGATYEKGRRLQDVVATLRCETEARRELGLGALSPPREEPAIQRIGMGE